MVSILHYIPPDALMPAFTSLVELGARDGKVLPAGQLQTACESILRRIAEQYPEKMPDFVRAAPEGPVRRLFETGTWSPEGGK